MRAGGFLPYFRVRDVRPLSSRESDSAVLHTLRVRYSDISVARALPDTMLLKVFHAGQPLADREVTFYRQIQPALRSAYGATELSICDGYDAQYDIATQQSHILLAGLPDSFKHHTEPVPPSRRHFGHLADAMARIHACFWEDESLVAAFGEPWTDELIDKQLSRQRAAYEAFLTDRMITLDSSQRSAFEAVVGRMPADFRERLVAGHDLTLIHNALEPANLLYAHQGCRIIDWKYWRPGLAAEDLAYMIAFHWPVTKLRFEEPRFLQRHWGEMGRNGVRNYSYDSFQLDYRIAVGLRLAELIGSWRLEAWRDGNWHRWDTILNGLRAFEQLNVQELFGG